MKQSAAFLSPAEAAKLLGVSAKALRLYEERRLIAPTRTEAGWRVYGPEDMARAKEIIALRALGFSLAQVARVLKSEPQGLEQALAAHGTALQAELRRLSDKLERVGSLQNQLAMGAVPAAGDLARLAETDSETLVTFALPWPWGGERFTLRALRPLTSIIGPLGSGKTRLAKRLAEVLPKAAFLGLDRLEETASQGRKLRDADPTLAARVEETLAWLSDEGARMNDALVTLISHLEATGPEVLIIDMIEEGLDGQTQQALIAHLRRCTPNSRPVIFLTRSTAILDLEAVGTDETILLCPANHSPPIDVRPYPGTAGYEAVATCLASPEVRARTAGVVAWRAEREGHIATSEIPLEL